MGPELSWGYEPFHPRRRYRPLEDILDEAATVTRCLNIGTLEEEVLATEVPLVVLSEPARELSAGCYWFGDGGGIELMIVQQGAEPTHAYGLAPDEAVQDPPVSLARAVARLTGTPSSDSLTVVGATSLPRYFER